ncbi:TPA: hypothetical protein DCX16_01825, partial [bacterium]|nr:hypothetical protein [bacterium]
MIKLKKYFPIFLLAGIVFLFFLPILTTSSIWGFRDFHRYVYPMRYFGRECVLSGYIPFWNPYVGCGMPYFAGLQGMAFYPPSILVYLLPYEIGLKAFIVFHFFVSCISTYLLALELGLGKPSSFVTSLVYGFSGWLISSIDIPIILCASAWIPLILLFLLKSRPILAGVFLSFQILSGEPSMYYLTSVFILLFGFFIRKPIFPILSILISLAISLFQLIPFLEFLSYSTRMKQLYAEGIQWAFSPYEVLRFILPSSCGAIVRGEEEPAVFFGQMWLKSPYIGIIPTLLTIIVIIWPRKNKYCLFFSYLGLVFLILSFGNHTPLYKLVYKYFPLFSLMRYPVKCLLITSLCLSILSGFGMEHILSLKKNPIRLFVFLGLLIIFLFTLAFIEESKIISLFPIPAHSFLKWWPDVLTDGFLIIAFIVFAIIILLLYKFSIITERAFILGFIGAIIIDLFFFGSNLCPLVDRYVYDKSETIMFLEECGDYFRIMQTPKTS